MNQTRRRFGVGAAWVAFLLVAALAIAGIWTGAVGPDLEVRSVASQTIAGPNQEVLEIRNARRSTVRLVDVGLAVPGLRRVAIQLLGPDGTPKPFRATPLAHGQSVDVLVTYREIPCDTGAFVAGDYTVTARTALGLTRTMHVERGDRVSRQGPAPYRFSDKPTARSEVRHRCGFYD